MRRQALVIGLGQFGMALAQSLSENGVEVIAIDRNPSRVQHAAEFSAEALCFDATDEDALARTSPDRRELAVCSIGDESREGSIIVTALLRQMGAPHILARATDDLHERILRMVGAHEVLNPERAFGARVALRLAYRAIRDVLPLGEDLVLTELVLPPSFVGRTLVELKLPRRFDVTVVAIRREVGGTVHAVMPDPRDPLRVGDVLLVVSAPAAAQKLAEIV